MSPKLLTLSLIAGLMFPVSAEMRRFQNADQTKSFYAELTGFDAKTNRVTVRTKMGRSKTFMIEILSEEDQKYVKENGKRLAVGNGINLSLKKFQEKSVKQLETRTVNRVAPSGYTISLKNRTKNEFSELTLNYTLYYEVQGYLKPERTPQEQTGTLVCKSISSQETISLNTETVNIVSGKLEPVISYKDRKDAEGNHYTEPHVDKPGGRRKDLLVGCKVELVIDGQVVKTETDGTIQIEQAAQKKR